MEDVHGASAVTENGFVAGQESHAFMACPKAEPPPSTHLDNHLTRLNNSYTRTTDPEVPAAAPWWGRGVRPASLRSRKVACALKPAARPSPRDLMLGSLDASILRLRPPTQVFLQGNGMIVGFIPGAINERDPASLRPLPRFLHDGSAAVQLGKIPPPELLPTGRVVAEPFPQGRAWRNLFQPAVEARLVLAEAAGPEPIDQDAITIVI